MINTKPTIYSDLINSFRFYMMLSIVLIDGGYDERRANRALMEFKKEVKASGEYSDKVIQANMTASYNTFPGEFLRLYQLPSVHDDIKMHEKL